MKKIGVLVVFAIAVGILTSGCTRIAREAKCKAATSREQCSAMSDDCINTTWDRCVGATCAPMCSPVEGDHICQVQPELIRDCARDKRTFDQGAVPKDISKYTWAFEKLSPAGRELAGRKLSKSDFEKLSESDGRVLCSSFPKDSCKMRWIETANEAGCRLDPNPCGACTYLEVKPICGAKNSCNGVICI